jgi:hypothetical protein
MQDRDDLENMVYDAIQSGAQTDAEIFAYVSMFKDYTFETVADITRYIANQIVGDYDFEIDY